VQIGARPFRARMARHTRSPKKNRLVEQLIKIAPRPYRSNALRVPVKWALLAWQVDIDVTS
jgi:hypothetical protein